MHAGTKDHVRFQLIHEEKRPPPPPSKKSNIKLNTAMSKERLCGKMTDRIDFCRVNFSYLNVVVHTCVCVCVLC